MSEEILANFDLSKRIEENKTYVHERDSKSWKNYFTTAVKTTVIFLN